MQPTLLSVLLLAGSAGLSVGDRLLVPSQHKTIQAAIAAARPGDHVIVAAGTYRERLQLKPGVVVRSAGDDTMGKTGLKRAEMTVIDGGSEASPAGPGVSMAEGSTIDGFTVTRVGRYDDALWNKHHASRGDEQSHEHIGGFGAPGIGVDGVNCTVTNNIVHHNGDTGIAIRGQDDSVVIPLVRGNVCYRNMGGGIGIMKGASGQVTANTCYENFYAGIGHSGASPHVENNVCHGNIRAGIGISEGACPVVRNNRCFKNRRAGIGIRTGKATQPLVINNECHENGMAGIGCDEGAAPTIQNNRCHHNAMAGIGARENSHPVIIGNECRENEAAGLGLAACEDGKAIVIGNTFVDNKLVAVGIQDGWDVQLTGNSLSRKGGLPPMIMVFENARCALRDNRITGNGVAAVRVAGTASLDGDHLDGGTVRKGGPPHFGVWALPGSSVTVSNCRIETWRHAIHATESSITAVNNSVQGVPAVAMVIRNPKGPARITGNVVRSDNPKFRAVEADGDLSEVRNNKLLPVEEAR